MAPLERALHSARHDTSAQVRGRLPTERCAATARSFLLAPSAALSTCVTGRCQRFGQVKRVRQFLTFTGQKVTKLRFRPDLWTLLLRLRHVFLYRSIALEPVYNFGFAVKVL